MSQHENIMWRFDELDLEAERLEFEDTLPPEWPRDRYFEDGSWEYVDHETNTAFGGWVRARLSARKRNAAQFAQLEGEGLLTESIDTPEFHAMACSWRDGGNVQWTEIIEHICGHAYTEVEAQRNFIKKMLMGEFEQEV